MKKYYAVIDTNVIVSALFSNQSLPGIVVQKAIDGEIIPLLNEEILKEYNDVLFRNKFSFDVKEVNNVLEALIINGINIEKLTTDEEFVDKDDIVFYEVLMSARSRTSEAYLVTGNQKHFPVRPFIVTPREMIEIIEKDTIE